jgi:hypothetical protein
MNHLGIPLPSAVAALALCFLNSATAQETLIPAGSTWKFSDSGPLEGTAWRSPDFDDSSWKSGQAQLGFGDGDEATLVSSGPSSSSRYITTYFRRNFIIDNPDSIPDLLVEVLRDDGAVVWVNGVEVVRSNMPSGIITPTTLASSSAAPADESTRFYAATVAGSLLRAGINTVAVEIHQDSATSSDLSFDLRLGPAPPSIISKGSAWRYLDNGSDPGPSWRLASFDDSSWPQGRAQLGFGDGDEQTTVGFIDTDPASDGIQKNITTWFRRKFTIDDPAAIAALQLAVLRDDGAVVWLNGTEVLRTNLPAGPILPSTLASASATNAEAAASFIATSVNPALLTPGENILAVEIHQDSPSSPDLSFDLRLYPIPTTLTRGPYLNRTSPTETTVRWRTSVPTDTVLRWGTDESTLNHIISLPELTTEHIVRVTGLLPETRYFYSTSSSSQTFASGPSLFFTTHPPAGSTRPFRFWALGDSGTGNANALAVRNAFSSWNGGPHTDFVLLLGDNAYNTGLDSEYQFNFFDIYPDTLRNSTVWPAMGNHEAFNSDSPSQSGPYYNNFSMPADGECGGVPSGTRAFYSFNYANTHFICLDSEDSPRASDGAMAQWLAADLDATTAEWIIAFWHHPPYTKGTHNSDSLSDSSGRMTHMREIILPIMESHGVDLVLNGHSHTYERSRFLNGHYGFSNSFNASTHVVQQGSGDPAADGPYIKLIGPNTGAVYTVTGSAGQTGGTFGLNHPAMIRSLAQLGSVAVDVNGTQLDLHFIHSSGEIRDSFRIVHNRPPAASPASLSTIQNVSAAVHLKASDPDFPTPAAAPHDANPLSSILTSPLHGTLSGTPPSLRYSPDPGFSGSDSFTFSASDGLATSPPATISITVLADSDTDLLADAWEIEHLGSLLAGPSEDPDLDGDSNRSEFLAGTIPSNPNSRLLFSLVSSSPSESVFSLYPVQPGIRYLLESSTDLTLWDIAASATFDTQGSGQLRDPVGNSPTRRFHRITLTPE